MFNFKNTQGIKGILFHCCVLVIVLFAIGPFLWLIITSISLQRELLHVPPHWIPHQPTLKNYMSLIYGGERIMETASHFKYSILNSLVVAGFVALICLAIGSAAAYSFARLHFKGNYPLFLSVIFIQMIPVVALIIPLYILMNKIGLLNTKLSLILAYSSFTLPFVIWVMRGYFETIPVNLEDAAAIDGCSPLGILLRIVLPLSAPGLVATGIFAFLTAWNEFFMALVFTSSYASKTVPVLISEFGGRYSIDYGLMGAATVIASVFPVFLALIFQKYIVRGLTSGAVKG